MTPSTLAAMAANPAIFYRPIVHFASETSKYASICSLSIRTLDANYSFLFVSRLFFTQKYPFLKPLHFAFPFGVSILCSFYTERGHFNFAQRGLYYFAVTNEREFLDKADLLDIIQPNKIHKNFDKD